MGLSRPCIVSLPVYPPNANAICSVYAHEPERRTGGATLGSLSTLFVGVERHILTLNALSATSLDGEYFLGRAQIFSSRADVGGRPRLLPLGDAAKERWMQIK